MSCDCLSTGRSEVKCPIVIKDGNFRNYVQQNSCLKKGNGHFLLRKSHRYYYQVQQQLFSVPEIKYYDFVVCAIDDKENMHLILQCLYPDEQHWNSVLPKLATFWRICILWEIIGQDSVVVFVWHLPDWGLEWLKQRFVEEHVCDVPVEGNARLLMICQVHLVFVCYPSIVPDLLSVFTHVTNA